MIKRSFPLQLWRVGIVLSMSGIAWADPQASQLNTPSAATYDDHIVIAHVANRAIHAFVAQLTSDERKQAGEFSAKVDCAVAIDGRLSDCKQVGPETTPKLADALTQELQRPDVQGPPMMLGGHAVAGRHVFGLDIRARRIRH